MAFPVNLTALAFTLERLWIAQTADLTAVDAAPKLAF
jgi:hypothetical protein